MDLTRSFESVVPEVVRKRYAFFEVRNAASVIASAAPEEFQDFVEVLDWFQLYTRDLITPGGNESTIAARLNGQFRDRGWREARVDTLIELHLQRKPWRGEAKEPPRITQVSNEGFLVDNFRARVALDVEWNAKDGNLDRDLSAYRALYDNALIDGAILITRVHAPLRDFGRDLARKAGQPEEDVKRILRTTTTTNTLKLAPKMTRGDAGGCPLLVAGISPDTWAGEGIEPPTDVPLVEVAD